VDAALATTIGNVCLDTERRRDRERDGDADGGGPRRTERDIRRDFDGLCVLRPHGRCVKRERDESDDSRCGSPHGTSSQPLDCGRRHLDGDGLKTAVTVQSPTEVFFPPQQNLVVSAMVMDL